MLERCTRIWWVAAGADPHFEQGEPLEPAEDAVFGPGGAAFGEARGHAGAPDGVAGDGTFHTPAFELHFAVHQRQIDLFDLPARKLRGQLLMGVVVLGHQQDAAGIAVEPVHDAGAQGAGNAGERAETVQQRVDQGSGMDAGAGVYHHAGRLIDGHHIRVFIEHGQGNGFRHGAERRRLGGFDVNSLTGRSGCEGRAGTPFTSTRPALIHC